jgi:hypothetical protein
VITEGSGFGSYDVVTPRIRLSDHDSSDGRRVSPVAVGPREGPLTALTAGAQPWPRERVLMLRVFGRLPVSGVTRCSEAGVRKASGEETAGEFAPAVVSVYGDLACVCPDLWISNGDHGRVIIVALALVAACRIGTVVL